MNQLSRAGIVGALLAVIGVILFLVLWGMLGQAGMDNFPRLILSMCIPPAAIALIMGIYILMIRSKA